MRRWVDHWSWNMAGLWVELRLDWNLDGDRHLLEYLSSSSVKLLPEFQSDLL